MLSYKASFSAPTAAEGSFDDSDWEVVSGGGDPSYYDGGSEKSGSSLSCSSSDRESDREEEEGRSKEHPASLVKRRRKEKKQVNDYETSDSQEGLFDEDVQVGYCTPSNSYHNSSALVGEESVPPPLTLSSSKGIREDRKLRSENTSMQHISPVVNIVQRKMDDFFKHLPPASSVPARFEEDKEDDDDDSRHEVGPVPFNTPQQLSVDEFVTPPSSTGQRGGGGAGGPLPLMVRRDRGVNGGNQTPSNTQ